MLIQLFLIENADAKKATAAQILTLLCFFIYHRTVYVLLKQKVLPFFILTFYCRLPQFLLLMQQENYE